MISEAILKKAKVLYNQAIKLGYSHASAIAVLANVMAESGFNEGAHEAGGGGGFGYGQWTPRENLFTQGKILGYSREQCLTALVQGDILLRGAETGQWLNAAYTGYDPLVISPLSLASYKKLIDINSATVNYMAHWERPSYDPNVNHKERRKQYAKEFNEKIKEGGGGTDPDPDPDPDPEPEPEPKPPEYDLEGIKKLFEDFIKELNKTIAKMLTADLYNYGYKNEFGSTYLKAITQMENMYKVKPTGKFNDVLNKLSKEALEKLGGLLKPIEPPKPDPDPEPEPEPEPEPSGKMYFPLNPKAQGINFWTPPDQPNMDYGGYRTGRRHWAYDIGTLGNANVSCHAVRDGKVLSVNADNLGTVVIKHSSDSYTTQYMHLKLGAFTVKAGDKVVAGQKIGIVGGTGGYDIHLHFAVSKNGTFGTEEDTINPRPYLKITANNVTGLPSPV